MIFALSLDDYSGNATAALQSRAPASTLHRLAAWPRSTRTAELDRPNLPLVIDSLALVSFGLSCT
ncbi:hypothetical protein [Rhodanobacter sp. KK11]|jgi:hypothetical protein|uniref:hypothetical protein n=1 Tax=Rhodanobacter sp. KK11 TaxID=3083255 RepID=UPI002965F8CA|nr:hypothetical protein [Rhodanobacter sp. KK11]MDW2982841.1 hypothetical protein [Rhodanobacter sp. KK11]